MSRLLLAVVALAALPALAQDEGEATVGEAVQAPAPEPEIETTGEAVQAPAPSPPPSRREDDLFKDEGGRDVPPSQYQPLAEEAIQQMRKDLTRGLEVLRDARDAKDAVRLNCVNDKVTAMKGILRISEDAFISLQEAMASNAPEKARYEFGKIKVSRKKMDQLANDAANCAGAEASYTGGTDVNLEVDEAVVGGDPYYGDQDFFATPEDAIVDGSTDGVGDEGPVDSRPPPASPFQ